MFRHGSSAFLIILLAFDGWKTNDKAEFPLQTVCFRTQIKNSRFEFEKSNKRNNKCDTSREKISILNKFDGAFMI